VTSDKIIKMATKLSRIFVAEKITADEYACNLLEFAVLLPEFDETTAQAVADSVPEAARNRLVQEIEKVTAADYRHRELHFGGPGPSPEERERMRREYEARIRAFAHALATAMHSA
jgi:hypothetical protein